MILEYLQFSNTPHFCKDNVNLGTDHQIFYRLLTHKERKSKKWILQITNIKCKWRAYLKIT